MNDRVKACWEAFRSSRPDLPDKPSDVFAFGNTPEMADELGALVVQGVKTATASALSAYEAGETLPRPGDLSVVVDGSGKPLCVVETTEVRVRPFAEVGAAFAHDEGEGDRSLAYWRNAHRRFFSETLPEPFDETMRVVCERFRVVWSGPNGARTYRPKR